LRDQKPYEPPRRCKYDEYSLLQFVFFNNSFTRACNSYLDDKNNNDANKFTLLPSSITCNPQLRDALIVHFRSGDIFRPFNPNPNYGQPPLTYYEQIFRSKNWSHIHFITSPHKPTFMNPIFTYFIKYHNPFINNSLQSNYQQNSEKMSIKTTFQVTNNLTFDLHTMLCARYFVTSRSTLSQLVVDLSPHLREYFTSHRCERESSAALIVCNEVYLRGYLFKNWTNSVRDRSRMFSFNRQGKSIPRMS